MTTIIGGASFNGVAGTTSLAIPGTAAVLAYGVQIIGIANKYPNNFPTTPAGWTLLTQCTGGNGAPGIDNGYMCASLFYRELTGDSVTNTGTVNVTLTSANSSVSVRFFPYFFNTDFPTEHPSDLQNYCIPYVTTLATGSQNTAGSTTYAVSVAELLNRAEPIKPDDTIVWIHAINSDTYTYSNAHIVGSNGSLPISTRGPGGALSTTSLGQDCSLYSAMFMHTGTIWLSGNYTLRMTGSSSSSTSPAGASILMVLRAVYPAPDKDGSSSGFFG